MRGLRAAHSLLGGVSGCYFTKDNFDTNHTPQQGEGSIRGGNEATNNAPRWGEEWSNVKRAIGRKKDRTGCKRDNQENEMSVRVQSILALKCYVVAFGDR